MSNNIINSKFKSQKSPPKAPACRQAGFFEGKIICPPKEDPSLKEKLIIEN